MSRIIIGLFWSLHLALVGLAALGLRGSVLDPYLTRLSDGYSKLTCSNREFNYFGPRVSKATLLSVTLVNGEKETSKDLPSSCFEKRVREATYLWNAGLDGDLELVLRGIAKRALDEHQDFEAVRVTMSVAFPVTMDSYRAGERNQIEEIATVILRRSMN